MNPKQELELTWIKNEDRPRLEPRLQVIFPEDPKRRNSQAGCHEAVLQVCGNPRCGCLSIQLRFQAPPEKASTEPPVPPRDFWLELNKRSLTLTPEQKKDPECLRLAKTITAQLTKADQDRLREWYLAEKLELIQTMPVSQIDIADLPDADGGKMIGFVDVFPCGLALNFSFENEVWAVDEQYCVQPDCTCQETVLSFLKLMDASGKKTKVVRDAPAIGYNYRTHKVRQVPPVPARCPPPDALLATLRRAEANLDVQLKLRHLILQALYARHHAERISSRIQSHSTSSARKIGRNEPCPCGSGRKYKHCCLKKAGPP